MIYILVHVLEILVYGLIISCQCQRMYLKSVMPLLIAYIILKGLRSICLTILY